MPRITVRATRYAAAAFGVAKEDNQVDAWADALARAAALVENRLAEQILTSPTIAATRKNAVLHEALPNVPPNVGNFLRLLTSHNRLAMLPEVAANFRRLANEDRGIAVAQVTTAVPISEAERDLIAARLSARTGRRVTVEARVDPRVLGGVIAQIGDDVIDGSVRGRLERLRRTLTA